MERSKKLLNFCWSTLRAKLPSTMHKEAWKKFKENLRIRDILAATFGMSNDIFTVILGADTVSKASQYMEDESNMAKLSDNFIKLWPYTSIMSRVFLLALVTLLLMSIKWQRLSQSLFYVGILYLMNECLLGLPEGFDLYLNPSTRLLTMIFVFIDKFLPQSLFVVLFWVVQYIISPALFGTQKSYDNDFRALIALMSMMVCANFIKNLIGMSFCNEQVSRKENWTFMTDCAKNVVIIRPGESFQVRFTKLSGVLKKILTLGNESNIIFDGLLPIDIKLPLFEVFNMSLFKSDQDSSNFNL